MEPPDAPVRVFIAPANFAAQGYAFARAAERLHGVGAVNMQPRAAQDFGFPADYNVPWPVAVSSGTWARRQREAVGRGFTHVLIEAERPIFGVAFDGDVEREVRWLRERGVSVALVSHGTDLRAPHRHADADKWSPFGGEEIDQQWVARLESVAQRNRSLGERLGVPLYVVTPELLLDWPAAQWLPNVVDPARWATASDVLTSDRPVVLHAPTSPKVKGTALIEPVMLRLAEQGVVDYRRVENVAADEMPRLYAGADIVLDQFALGIYSTTSIEAMASGRLVVAHLSDQVRSHVKTVTGMEPPIVEATPDTLASVIHDIVTNPDRYRRSANLGPQYVAAVHDGEFSAQVLRPFLHADAGEDQSA
ncbi:hypothetical protein [Microbacterium sp.]|uniref:hypothetical protein n=1 Tax=Microbacterium sp. TaxID=51671 RepID=UPI00262591A6|nr:hypothetical protein [Microbacterium sp.]